MWYLEFATAASVSQLDSLTCEKAITDNSTIDDEERSMQLGIDPKNCVVVEDAAAGVQAARLAGKSHPEYNPVCHHSL